MNDDIIRMAREAGSIDSEDVIEAVYFAFAAHEREECAKIVGAQYESMRQHEEHHYRMTGRTFNPGDYDYNMDVIKWSRSIAAAIRARGRNR